MRFLLSIPLFLILCGSAFGGASPSPFPLVGIDTVGDGVAYNYIYPAYIKEGTNIVLGLSEDTLTISGPAGAGTIDSFFVIFTDSASAANGNKHVSGFLTPGDTLYVDTSSGAGGFNWQDSAGEPPFWVDSSKHADSAYNSDSLGHVAASSYLTSESDPVWTSDSVDYAMKTWIGPFIDTTTLDTIANAHDAVAADSAGKALQDAAGNTITTTYEVQLNNEAGLYDVLSDVSNFVQDAEVPGLETDATALAAVGDTVNARMTKAVTGNTETRIEVTYNSADSTYDFVVDDMNDDSIWGQITIGNDSTSDHYIYFENGTTDKYFMWDSSTGRFALNSYLGVTGTIEAYSADVIAQQNMRINSAPSATYGNLYFYEAGTSDGAYFRFDTVNNRFEVSHPLGGYFDTAAVVDTVQGVLTEGGYLTNSKFSDSSITLLNATAWRLFYSNATTTAIQELILGSDGTYLKSNGASLAPTWATPGGAGWNWTDSTGFLVGWGGVAKSVVNDTNYFRFEGGADFDTTGGSVSLADDAVDPVVLKDSNVQAQGDIVTIAASSEFGFKTASELALMEDGDINTFSELQSWVSDKTLVNEEDIFTIDANWVNTANPWADNEVTDALTVTGYMQDEDINTFAELQSWVSNKTLLNEEDAFTIDAGWTFAGLVAADSINAAHLVSGNVYLGNDTLKGIDVLVVDTVVVDGEVIKDFTGTNLSVTDGVLNASGEVNILSDTGTYNDTEGFGLAGGKTGVALKVKGLIEGSRITITKSGDSALTITSTGTIHTGEVTGGDELTIAANIIDTSNMDHAPLGKLIRDTITDEGYITDSKFSDSSITLLNATAWRLFYSNATTTAIQELILGGDGTYLKSNGASAAPTWETPAGGGGLLDTIATKDTVVLVGAAATDTTLRIYRTTDGVDSTTMTPETGVLVLGLEGTTRIDSLTVDLIKDADNVTMDTVEVTASLEIPNSDNPTVDANGEIAWENDDGCFRVKIGDSTAVIGAKKYFGVILAFPKNLYDSLAVWTVFPVMSSIAPHGIYLESLWVQTDNSSSYSVIFEEWSSPSSETNDIDTIATSAGYEAGGVPSDRLIIAGGIIKARIPATTGTKELILVGSYWIRAGD